MLRKWPPKKAGLWSTSLPHKYQRGKPKAGLLWRPFLNIRDKVIGHLVCIGRKVFEKEVHLWQKIHSARYGKECIFLSQMNLLLKDFSAYANQMTNDLVSYVEKMAAKGRPLVYLSSSQISKRKTKGRPSLAAISQHKRQGHWSFGLHRQKSLWEGGSSVTKIHSARYGKECIFCHRWTSFSKTFLPMQTKWPMTLSLMLKMAAKEGRPLVYLSSSQISRGKPKAGLLWRPFLNIRQVIDHLVYIGKKVFGRRFICDKNTFCPIRKRMYFLSQMNLLLKDFSAYANQWPMTLSLMLRKWPPKKAGLWSTSLPHKYQRKTKGRPSLAAFLDKNKVIGHLVYIDRKKSLRRRFICDKNTFCPIRKRMYFLSQMNLLLKDFSAYANQMTNDLVSYVENGRQRRPAFGLPLFLTNIKEENQRPAFFGGFSQHKRQGHWSFGLHRQKSLWKEVHLWQKYILPDTEKNVFFVTDEPPSQRLFCLCKPNDQWPCLLCWKMAAKKAGLWSTSLPHKYQKRKTKGRPSLAAIFST